MGVARLDSGEPEGFVQSTYHGLDNGAVLASRFRRLLKLSFPIADRSSPAGCQMVTLLLRRARQVWAQVPSESVPPRLYRAVSGV
jgi:hypothetical protein